MSDNELIDRLHKINLLGFAKYLGLNVIERGGRGTVHCLFHEDRNPSLSIYRTDSGDWRFKCFSCNAAGDIFDLTEKARNTDFAGALRVVADYAGEKISSRPRTVVESPNGLVFAFDIYQKLSPAEKRELENWGNSRSFQPSILKRFGVVFAGNQKLSTSLDDREMLAALSECGLVVRGSVHAPHQPGLDIEIPVRDALFGERIIFPVRDEQGTTRGFIGRAVGTTVTPKYLFTRGFQKSQILYGMDVVRSETLKSENQNIHVDHTSSGTVYLHIVEGPTDVIRLASLALVAVAVLGSDISPEQAAIISRFARDLNKVSKSLVVRLFFDGDRAGIEATRRALAKLLPLLTQSSDFTIEIVTPLDQQSPYFGSDPDSFLRDKNESVATRLIQEETISVGQFLLAHSLRCMPNVLNDSWRRTAATLKLAAMRRVDSLLPQREWKSIFNTLGADFFSTTFSTLTTEENWPSRLESFLRRSGTDKSETIQTANIYEKSEYTKVLQAIQTAHSFSQRREFPMDASSWDRLLMGSSVTVPYLIEIMQSGECNLEPLLAMSVEKSSGGKRLKAIPCPEQLAIQQYLLNELLGGSTRFPLEFEQQIPAVRYSQGTTYTTGFSHDEQSQFTHCYSYQIDMEVVRGEKPAGEEGVFRPYRECWADFVKYLSDHVRENDKDYRDDRPFHVARLDVRAYYDTLPRLAVDNALFEPLREALKSLDNALDFAPSFRSEISETDGRVRAFIDELCEQSFGYSYCDPDTGRETKFNGGTSLGIPQGPSLSAYIGSIALFQLDRSVSKAMEGSDAAYARYVDDMVVITRSKKELDHYRGLIQKELERIGLELSPKVDPLPPMNGVQVQNWLVANRGLAEVSGAVQTPPVIPMISDDGCVDRRAALSQLHDPDLQNPDTAVSKLSQVVRNVLRCPEVRFRDKCHAASVVWSICARETNSKEENNTLRNVVATFKEHWLTEDSAQLNRKQKEQWTLLAAVHGLDSFLSSRAFLPPNLDDAQHNKVYSRRTKLSSLILEGLIEELLAAFAFSVDSLSYILANHELNLIARAMSITKAVPSAYVTVRVQQLRSKYPKSTNVTRHIVSIATRNWDSEIGNSLKAVMHGDKPQHIHFHEAVSRLSSYRQSSTKQSSSKNNDVTATGLGVDPLESLRSEIVNAQRQEENETWLTKTLVSWLPANSEEDGDIAVEVAIPSLRVFLNLVGREDCAALLGKRPQLVKAALHSVGNGDVKWLPCLPIERFDGFVGYSDDAFYAVPLQSVDLDQNTAPNAVPHLSPKLSWESQESSTNQPFFKANSGELTIEHSEWDDPWSNPRIATWIADSFEKLVAISSDGKECPPHRFNLLSEKNSATDAIQNVLGYSISTEFLVSQSFVRAPIQGLMPKQIHANGGRFWRAGIAIADFLGLIDEAYYDPLKSIVRPSLGNLNEDQTDHRWALEKLVRFSLQRLCGRTANSSRIPDSAEIPRSLKRVLGRLRRFPLTDDPEKRQLLIGTVLAAVFETRFAAARFDYEQDAESVDRPGAAVDLIARTAKSVIYTDRQLASRLPKASSSLYRGRRNVEAWLSLATRINLLVSQIGDASEEMLTPLTGLANALSVHGLSELLRCLTLEIIAAEDGLKERLLGLNPKSVSLGDWNLDNTEMYVRKNLHDSADEVDAVSDLLEVLNRGLRNDNRNQMLDLARITPLGWSVAIGIVSGALRSDLRLSFLSASSIAPEHTARLKEICQLLRRTEQDGDESDSTTEDDPWFKLGFLLDRSTFAQSVKSAKQLEEFARSLGLFVSELKSSRSFRMEPSEFEDDAFGVGRRTWDISLEGESIVIEPWRIATASTANERSSAKAESHTVGETKQTYWTETRYQNHVIGIHVAQPGIAALAGFDPHSLSTNTSTGEMGKPENRLPAPSGDSGDTIRSDTTSEATRVSEDSSVPIQPTVSQLAGSNSNWPELLHAQENSWKKREKSSDSHYKRIALVQWQVEDFGSYRHPMYECCPNSLTEESSKKGYKLGEHQEPIYAYSPVEMRRRRILDEVLRACRLFGVDLLLLPEYSTRPETVVWLQRQLKLNNVKTSVWAGTFRLPPFYNLSRSTSWLQSATEWSAVLPVVLDTQVDDDRNEPDIRIRLKKYPSIAYNEIFNPSASPLQAISERHSRVTELICSEIFLASSPTNLIGLWKTIDALNQRFGKAGRSRSEGIDQVLMDMREFANATAMCNSEPELRRSILFVPSMTPRTVDYAVLGQASYLAAGLTTVFCNESGHSHGQSCFIGQDGWDRDDSSSRGIPGSGPYHGINPGIYHPFQVDRGWLGSQEQAMVIADVDPIYQAEGKPRPQNLMPPLNLVAHLPILEVGEKVRTKENKTAYGHLRLLPYPNIPELLKLSDLKPEELDGLSPEQADALRRGKWPTVGFWQTQNSSDLVLRSFIVTAILSELQKEIRLPIRPKTTMQDSSNYRIVSALNALAHAVPENSNWLKRRATAYGAEHSANPMPYPPPTILDWLYVNLDADDNTDSVIQVPPYSKSK